MIVPASESRLALHRFRALRQVLPVVGLSLTLGYGLARLIGWLRTRRRLETRPYLFVQRYTVLRVRRF